jgi:hypothetical protein
MKITRRKLKKLINESLTGDNTVIDTASMEQIKDLIKTLDNANIKQAESLCDALSIDFKGLVKHTVAELIDSKWKIPDEIGSDVIEQIQKIVKNNLGFYLDNNEENSLYLADENKAANISMEFYYGITGSIIDYIERYIADMIVAIGNE